MTPPIPSGLVLLGILRRLLEKACALFSFQRLQTGGEASATGTATRYFTSNTPAWPVWTNLLPLLRDLKQRGLLKDTLVVWCTEFGRMPTEGASGGP